MGLSDFGWFLGSLGVLGDFGWFLGLVVILGS